jgi:hypothetical protein
MKLSAAAIALLAFSAALAWAWPQEVQTRFGPLEIVQGQVDKFLRFAGRAVTGPDGVPESFRLDIRGVWQFGSEDVALVQSWAGGNDVCASAFLIVAVSSAGARATAPFGTCSMTVLEARVLAARIEFDLSAADPRVDHVAVTYSGGAVDTANVPMQEVAAPIAGKGDDVTRWQGVHPYEVLKDPGERQRFFTIMPRDKLFELMDRMSVASGTEIEDGWLIGEGCMAHMCTAEEGAFTIEVASGRVQAVIYHDDSTPEPFGGPLEALHPRLQAFARRDAP